MEETQFRQLADSYLSQTLQKLEEVNADDELDIELHDGIIDIVLPDGRTYVINRHTPSRQIWLSSPISGANYFVYDETKQKWYAKSGLGELCEIVISELKGVM